MVFFLGASVFFFIFIFFFSFVYTYVHIARFFFFSSGPACFISPYLVFFNPLRHRPEA